MKKTFLKFFISIIVIVLIIVAVLYISSRFQDISGIVILINDNEIYIKTADTIKEGDEIKPYPSYYVINTDNATFYDVNGKKISISDLKGGDSIRINYQIKSGPTTQVAYEFTPIDNVKTIKVLNTDLNNGTNSKIHIKEDEAKLDLENASDITISYIYPKFDSNTNMTSTTSINSKLSNAEINELFTTLKDYNYEIMAFNIGNYISDEYYKIDFGNGIYLKIGTSGRETDVYENDHRVFRTTLPDNLVNKIRESF